MRVAHKPFSSTATTWTTEALPADLLRQGARRIGFIGLIAAATAPVAWLAERMLQPSRLSGLASFSAVALFVLGMSVFAAVWSRRVPPAAILDLGYIFEVLGALAIALSESANLTPAGQPIHGVSWICVWITIFVAAVPGTYGKAVLAAIAAAVMQPVGLAIATVITGNPLPTAPQLVILTGPVAAAALWTIPIALHLHRLRAEVSRERELGSYRLVERIASGGMGEVWRAEHRMLARPAAVKLIRPDMLGARSDVARRRFEREAHAIAMLRSPHTVALYDYGITDDGQFYYAMELLDGIDLDALVTRFGPQPAGRAVHILRQACNSLAEAHERGLVHRDIKPRNLMLCRLGIETDCVKVLDFGLAKDPSGDTELTAEGTTAGTPAFLAPEAALGRREVDGRADLYGLGCVAYWLLTGRLVFERDTPMGMIVAHAHEQAPPLSARTEMPVPERLEAVVLACLEKDREARPASARELDRLLAACGLEWPPEAADRWWNINEPH